MKISIFPKAKPHPKSKEEKHKESMKVSAPNKPEVRSIANDEQLIEAVSQFAWSPFIFSGTRLESNFVSCDFLVYDVDEGMKIDEAEIIVKKSGYCCLCLPSTSHTEDAHRFRIIFPLASTITDPEIFRATWKEGAELFGIVDEQCKDIARFYFGCTQNDGFWQEGDLFTPVVPVQNVRANLEQQHAKLIDVNPQHKDFINQIYGEERKFVPECVQFFIENAHTGLPGTWINALNAAVFSLSLSGVDESVIVEAMEKLAPNSLDGRDMYQIKRAVKDGIKART